MIMSGKTLQDVDIFSEVDSLESISRGSGNSGSGSSSSMALRRKRKRVNNLKLKLDDLQMSLPAVTPPASYGAIQPSEPQENGDVNTFHYIVQQGVRRKTCEDKCHVDLQNLYFSIFDGHGGVDAAEFAASRLCTKIVYEKRQLRDAFLDTDREFLSRTEQELEVSGGVCGTTAMTVIATGGKLHIAHVGDSRAVLIQGNQAYCLTTDHCPTSDTEASRIEGNGGYVLRNRVNGVVAVSRAIGDPSQKKFIIAEPEVVETPMSSRSDYLILATDGLWSVVNENQVAAALEPCRGNLKLGCRALIDLALAHNSVDDIGVLILRISTLIEQDRRRV